MGEREHDTHEREYDYTKLSTFLTCRRKYYWRMVRHLISPKPSKALEFGRVMHRALDEWYQTHDVQRAKDVFAENWTDDPADDKRTVAVGQKILALYHERYAEQPITLVAVEKQFSIPLLGFNYIGKIDKIVEWDGAVFVMDHKTTSRLNADYFNKKKPNMQFDGYTWAARKLGHKCAGVVVDALLVAKSITQASWRSKGHEVLARDVSTRSDVDLALFIDRTLRIVRDVESCGIERIEDWYQNTESCTMWNSKCPYYKLCLEDDRRVIDTIVSQEYVEDVWKPVKREEVRSGSEEGQRD